MKLYYSPYFTGACYRKLPVGQPLFEKIVGDAGLLEHLELRLGLPGNESDTIDRILAYRKALETVAKDAFYEDAFKKDSLATAKEILRWRDVLVMEGFEADAGYKSSRLRKLAEAEKVFRSANLVGTPERWKAVLAFAQGRTPGADIEVCHDIELLPKLVRDTLKAFGVVKGRYDGLGEENLPLDNKSKEISILQFSTVADAYRWAVENNDCEAVICPDPFQLNAALRNREKPLLDASAGGDSSITQLFRLGMSLLERPVNVKNVLEFLRMEVSPIRGNLLAFALKRDGGLGEEWKKALDKSKDRAGIDGYLLSLLEAKIEDGKVSASVVTGWCQAVEGWAPSVMNKDREPYLKELIGLCRSMRRVIEAENADQIDFDFIQKAVKTLYVPKPVQVVKAMAGSWNAVDSHRCFIDAPASLLWLPCNGGLDTSWPYSFMLQDEIKELGVMEMPHYVRYDFNLMARQLGQVSKIVLCACDYDGDEAQEEHPAVTLCNPVAEKIDKRAAGDSTLSIFAPLGTIETGVDLYPMCKQKKEDGTEEEVEISLSASSIETLIGYPFDFVMDKKLGFRDLSSLRMSDLTPTQGTVAHYVFERMLKDSGGKIEKMREMLKSDVFENRVDDAAKEKGAALFQPEHRTLFSHFKETIQKSIGVLLDILEKNGLQPKDSEVKLDEDLAGLSHITGSVDFYAEKGDKIIVIDFKYSKGSHYIDKLKKDQSVQLEVYAESLEAKLGKLGKTVVAEAYYFFPINQLYTDSKLFQGTGVKHIKKNGNLPKLSTRIRKSVDRRREEIKKGKLEIEEGTPVTQIDYHVAFEDKKELIDIPSKKDEITKEYVKEYAPFADPTRYPILKNIIK